MKKYIPLLILTGLLYHQVFAQQKFTHTVTKENISCNYSCSFIDIAELDKNPNAILFATPVEGTGTNLDRHPIGAYYMYLKKWSIFNLDGTSMIEGAKYNVEYYATPGQDQFVCSITQRISQKGVYYIDREGLDDNPNAKVQIFPTSSPTMGALFNRSAVKAGYDVDYRKWYIANVNGQPLTVPQTSYNIAFTRGAVAKNTNTNKELDPNIKSPVSIVDATNANTNKELNSNIKTPVTNNGAGGNCNCPKSLPPDGDAGGDLSGTYPSPWIQKLNGRELSRKAPAIGDVLKWDGYKWEATPGTKPSIYSFRQSGDVEMNILNVNKIAISGLDDRHFTVDHYSEVVFYTSIIAEIPFDIPVTLVNAVTGVMLNVEIYDSLNKLVARATNASLIGRTFQTMVAVGHAALPKGTYHTSVKLTRSSDFRVKVFGAFTYSTDYADTHQGGDMIIELFPINDY